jgi:hypothetical protein
MAMDLSSTELDRRPCIPFLRQTPAFGRANASRTACRRRRREKRFHSGVFSRGDGRRPGKFFLVCLPNHGPDLEAWYVIFRASDDKPGRFTVQVRKTGTDPSTAAPADARGD